VDFWTALKIIVRRWYVVVPVLTLAAIVGWAQVAKSAPQFEAEGKALVLSPPAPRDNNAAQSNPLTGLDYSTAQVASVIAGLMNDGAVKRQMVAKGSTPDYEIGLPQQGSPVVSFVATAASADQAIRSVGILFDGLESQLEARQSQAGAPPATWLRLLVLTEPDRADEVVTGKVRAAAAIGALGLAAALSLAFVVDGVLHAHKREDEDVEEPISLEALLAPHQPPDFTRPTALRVTSAESGDDETSQPETRVGLWSG
jgi:hypothetical protein